MVCPIIQVSNGCLSSRTKKLLRSRISGHCCPTSLGCMAITFSSCGLSQIFPTIYFCCDSLHSQIPLHLYFCCIYLTGLWGLVGAWLPLTTCTCMGLAFSFPFSDRLGGLALMKGWQTAPYNSCPCVKGAWVHGWGAPGAGGSFYYFCLCSNDRYQN